MDSKNFDHKGRPKFINGWAKLLGTTDRKWVSQKIKEVIDPSQRLMKRIISTSENDKIQEELGVKDDEIRLFHKRVGVNFD
ncbi:MAG: hypothetical protein AAF363_15700 [Bacteroidota bacterium]